MQDVLVAFSKHEGSATELAFEVSSFGRTTQQNVENMARTQQTESDATEEANPKASIPSPETAISITSQSQCQVFTLSLLRVGFPFSCLYHPKTILSIHHSHLATVLLAKKS